MSNRSGQNLLLVEGDPALLGWLRRNLAPRFPDVELHFATGPKEALARLVEGRIDAVLLDVDEVGEAAFSLLEQRNAKPSWAKIPVVAIAQASDDEAKRKALDAGATDLLNKPIDECELAARVQNALRLKACEDHLVKRETALEEIVRERTRELESAQLSIIVRLAKVAELRDEDTGNHVVRVGCFAEAIAKQMDMGLEFARLILLSGPMHDIGKVGVPDYVLRKAGPLSEDEWRIMRSHCQQGARLLQEGPRLFLDVVSHGRFQSGADLEADPVLKMASRVALCHHERWDGLGYPLGLCKAGIPVEARIVAVADVFDALTSDRPYRQALSPSDAVEVMLPERARHFDPEVFDAFIRSFDRIMAAKDGLADNVETAEAA